MANIGRLVEKARAVKCPIVHIRHLGTVGGPFDPHGERGELVPELLPQGDEHRSRNACPMPSMAPDCMNCCRVSGIWT